MTLNNYISWNSPNIRNDLYTEIKKLHEANVKLRERNLAVGRELTVSNRENLEIRSRWGEEDRSRSRNRLGAEGRKVGG